MPNPATAHGIALPESATATAAAAGLTRKAAGRAMSSVEHNRRVAGNKRGRPKLSAESCQVIENSTLICNILRSAEKRAKIIAQLQRLRQNQKRQYDPRNAPRIIAQRLHYPQIAVELVIQGQPGEMEIWLREYRAVRPRAEAAIEQYWMGRAA